MPTFDWLQLLSLVAALTMSSPLLGHWIARILEGETPFSRFLVPVENRLYRVIGTSPQDQMDGKRYFQAILSLTIVGIVFLFLLQVFQSSLPLNPQKFANVSWHLALNTAVSFVTNTNWQAYAGESSLSYFVQMIGLTAQNFLSAATGIAVLVALARGIRNQGARELGNFWVDVTRSTLYVLLPLSLLLALGLCAEGVVQNFSPSLLVQTVEGQSQTLPMGPAASQIAIKQLGTNGGGFFNANSAHPFENPTPLSNWLQLLSILLIPAALPFAFGKWVRRESHGLFLFTTMGVLLLSGIAVSLWSESLGHPTLSGPMMEGKETRFSTTESILWSVFTTAASNGSVNSMISSLSPISGGVALFNILLGEIIFGGVGSGLYGMVVFVLLAVFLAGLMVGRSPEYLGKKLEAKEMQMAMIAMLIPNTVILLGTGFSLVFPIALESLSNKGPHGLTEMLYAFASTAGNNGSAFAGLNANTPYFNTVLALAMLLGRFGVILPVLVLASSLGVKKTSPPSPGSLPTETPLFGLLLLSVIVIVGGLTFLPALSLGPLLEHFLFHSGKGL
jgi:potassium-transporting ATPase potassium-binding subunit